MAIAGSGIPAMGVHIRRKQLQAGAICNKPSHIVYGDMSEAADHLRAHPETIIQIDARWPNYGRLLDYLQNTGHVEP